MEAFPERMQQLPLHTSMDANDGYNVYKWKTSSAEPHNIHGARIHAEPEDNFYHTALRYPWVTTRPPFHPLASTPHPPSTTPSASPGALLNSDFNHLMTAYKPEEGFKEAPLNTAAKWQRLLAFHHGLYKPNMNNEAMTADEIRLKTNHFNELMKLDAPQDPCRLLAVEEFKCLHASQTFMDIEGAAKSCVKWFNEWQQCKWDEEKYIKGYNYIEDRTARKHKPYIAAPDYQYS